MEHFIRDIEAYTEAAGTTPQRFLRAVINSDWGLWLRWKARNAYPTARTMDRVRQFMRENPVQIEAAE